MLSGAFEAECEYAVGSELAEAYYFAGIARVRAFLAEIIEWV